MGRTRRAALWSIVLAAATSAAALSGCRAAPESTSTASAAPSVTASPAPPASATPVPATTEAPLVLTSTPRPSPTAVPTLPPLPTAAGSNVCPNTLPSLLMPGRQGRVDNSTASTNRIRSAPGLTGTEIIGEIPAGARFDVLEGPLCQDDMAWFLVRREDGLEGWMGEGTAGGYWVMPISYDQQSLEGPEIELAGLGLLLDPALGGEALWNRIPFDPDTGTPPFQSLRFPGYPNQGGTAVVYVYEVEEVLYYAADRSALLEQVRAEINLLLRTPGSEVNAPAVLSWIGPNGAPLHAAAGPFPGGFGYRAVVPLARTDGSRSASPHFVFYGFTQDMSRFVYAAFELDLTFGTHTQAGLRDFTPSNVLLETIFSLKPVTPTADVEEAGTVTKCPGAPVSTLKANQWVQVSLDPPLPSRLRAAPGFGGQIVGEAPPGANLLVLDGPACANGFAWWQVRRVDGLEGWTIEGDEVSYWLVNPISPWTVLPPALQPGDNVPVELTEIRMSVPGVFNLPGDLDQVYFPMATPLPTIAPNDWQEDPRELNHREHRRYLFRNAGSSEWMIVYVIPVTEALALNWSFYREYTLALAAMADSGNILTASLRPFLGLEGPGAPIKIISSARAMAFSGGRGARFLVGTHNATPVLNPIYYVFQGVSDDGSLYIYLFYPVISTYLVSGYDANQGFGPYLGWNDEPTGVNVQASFDAIDVRIQALLDAGVLPLYPGLDVLDAMVESIEIK